ncbi:hypothetical protein V5E97_16805 [Singulisphaera sp. Ch08]|uniref:Thioredoxin domain-containing protein n=1 Tax=Singulisphaera sp. Ch08 TaxID=3120278 RepID=A0AAU7CRI5_9BACT
MTRWVVGVWCLLGALTALADDPVFSGPQVGEKLTTFKATAFSGPQAGREVEIPGPNAGRPTVLVFVHEITRPALQLIRPIDHFGAKWADLGLTSQIIWLAADPAQAEQFLERAKKSLNLKIPVAIAPGGIEGPGNYGLNRNVTLTILVANEGNVVANFAIVQPNETDAPKVLAPIAKLLGKAAPSMDAIKAEVGTGRMMSRPEAARPAESKQERSRPAPDRIGALEEKVAALTEALNEARARIARLEGTPPPAPIGGRSLPDIGNGTRDPELQRLMRQLIQLKAEQSQVDQTAKEMARWAGDDPRKKSELAQYSKLVIELGYGTEAAKNALKAMAKD